MDNELYTFGTIVLNMETDAIFKYVLSSNNYEDTYKILKKGGNAMKTKNAIYICFNMEALLVQQNFLCSSHQHLQKITCYQDQLFLVNLVTMGTHY